MPERDLAVPVPSPSVQETEAGIVADEGPFIVDGWYVPDLYTRFRARWALVQTLTRLACQLRAWARSGDVSPERAVAPRPRPGVLRCAYCTRVILAGEAHVFLAGARIHNSDARPCYARYSWEYDAWDDARRLEYARAARALSITTPEPGRSLVAEGRSHG